MSAQYLQVDDEEINEVKQERGLQKEMSKYQKRLITTLFTLNIFLNPRLKQYSQTSIFNDMPTYMNNVLGFLQ